MRGLIAFGLVLSSSGPALACAVHEAFYVEDIAGLPVVVLAEVAGYGRDGEGQGALRLAVTEVWKGEAPEEVTARWTVSLAEMPPETWDGRPAGVIAALVPAEDGGFDLYVEPCGDAHLVEATAANLAAVKAALP